eukprot:TRINITY_DN8988_c0_g1_i1.p4 TRINITY_DN8988_c0_g1~~TRINITY_DN8988_c0_g1_i1.p4  ORF type:complete len:168 (-),score=29.16 TRINITY_DN8988_c0_g1_i1:359-862(-)
MAAAGRGQMDDTATSSSAGVAAGSRSHHSLPGGCGTQAVGRVKADGGVAAAGRPGCLPMAAAPPRRDGRPCNTTCPSSRAIWSTKPPKSTGLVGSGGSVGAAPPRGRRRELPPGAARHLHHPPDGQVGPRGGGPPVPGRRPREVHLQQRAAGVGRRRRAPRARPWMA